MTKKLMAALMAVMMVTLTGCAGGLGSGLGYRNPYRSPNAVTRVTARNMGMTQELLGLAFPRFLSDPSYYSYGFDNPYSYGGYDYGYGGYGYGYGSDRWYYRQNRNDVWKVLGGAALGVGLGYALFHKNTKPESAPAVATQLPAEAPVPEQSCIATQISNQTGMPVFVGELGGQGFFLEPGQTISACITSADCAFKYAGSSLIPTNVVFQDGAVIIR